MGSTEAEEDPEVVEEKEVKEQIRRLYPETNKRTSKNCEAIKTCLEKPGKYSKKRRKMDMEIIDGASGHQIPNRGQVSIVPISQNNIEECPISNLMSNITPNDQSIIEHQTINIDLNGPSPIEMQRTNLNINNISYVSKSTISIPFGDLENSDNHEVITLPRLKGSALKNNLRDGPEIMGLSGQKYV